MKILFLADFIPPRAIGGPGKRVYELAKKLSQKGNEVFIITSCQKKNLPLRETRNGLEIFNIYSNYNPFFRDYLSIYNFRILSKVEEIIKEVKPDIIQADGIHFHLSYVVLKIARKYSKKVFFTARDAMTFNYGKLWPTTKDCRNNDYRRGFFSNLRRAKWKLNPLRNILINRYLKYADKIFTNSHFLKEALRQNRIYNASVIHNGLEVKNLEADPHIISDFKIKHGLQDKKVVFLPGRINEAKGSFVILDIMPEIINEVPEAILLMVGAGADLINKMEKFAFEKGVAEAVKIFPWTNDENFLKAAYLLSDVVASPSLCYDMFPGVNLEAALYKKPVVTTCFGGAKEFISDSAFGGAGGQTGYVVNPYNKKELAQKIIDLLKNEEKAKGFGQASFKRLKEHFSLDQQAEKLLDWYGK